ncbi:hypothetical protein H072_8822 [Dactylellina haptotyla CBS 200.50]|uniref:Uncharacterized protein n=1 Tax=Dactylellina haptotyla (strain CBS 200.50) TaxID=1284197 RepID=S8A3G3_DACHA|nr:hypothetical protein H072_8822 [Dactylellina haptotyla CBS 200.50]
MCTGCVGTQEPVPDQDQEMMELVVESQSPQVPELIEPKPVVMVDTLEKVSPQILEAYEATRGLLTHTDPAIGRCVLVGGAAMQFLGLDRTIQSNNLDFFAEPQVISAFSQAAKLSSHFQKLNPSAWYYVANGNAFLVQVNFFVPPAEELEAIVKGAYIVGTNNFMEGTKTFKEGAVASYCQMARLKAAEYLKGGPDALKHREDFHRLILRIKVSGRSFSRENVDLSSKEKDDMTQIALLFGGGYDRFMSAIW